MRFYNIQQFLLVINVVKRNYLHASLPKYNLSTPRLSYFFAHSIVIRLIVKFVYTNYLTLSNETSTISFILGLQLLKIALVLLNLFLFTYRFFYLLVNSKYFFKTTPQHISASFASKKSFCDVKKHHFLLKEMVIFDPFLAKVRYLPYFLKKRVKNDHFFKQKSANSDLYLKNFLFVGQQNELNRPCYSIFVSKKFFCTRIVALFCVTNKLLLVGIPFSYLMIGTLHWYNSFFCDKNGNLVLELCIEKPSNVVLQTKSFLNTGRNWHFFA